MVGGSGAGGFKTECSIFDVSNTMRDYLTYSDKDKCTFRAAKRLPAQDCFSNSPSLIIGKNLYLLGYKTNTIYKYKIDFDRWEQVHNFSDVKEQSLRKDK